MSDKDHKGSHDHDHGDHDHDHGHSHGHGHDHDHDHGHGHDHDHGTGSTSKEIYGHDKDHLEELLGQKKDAPEPEPEVTDVDDPSTRALSDALRSSFAIVKVLMVILVVIFFSSGVFQVKENEAAVILRLGKPVGQGTDVALKPGLHWAFPYPIDEIVKIPLGQSHSVLSTGGWPVVSPDQEIKGDMPSGSESLRPGVDGYVLTSDGNIIHVKATLNYRITDPVRYTFEYADTAKLLQGFVDNAIFYAATHFTAERALYGDKAAFREKVADRVQQLVAQHNLGVTLEPINVDTSAPFNVRPSYEAVQQSDLDRNEKVNAAQGDAGKLLREAEGEAQALISGGMSESNQLVQAVRAEAATYSELLPLYRDDPNLFKRRVMTEKIQTVMTNAQAKFFIPNRADGKSRELRLQLNREPVQPKANQ